MIRQCCKEALGVIAAAVTALATAPSYGTDSLDIATPWTGHGNAPGPGTSGFDKSPDEFNPSWPLPDPGDNWDDLIVIDLWIEQGPGSGDNGRPLLDDAIRDRYERPADTRGAPQPNVPAPGVIVVLAVAAALGTRRRARTS